MGTDRFYFFLKNKRIGKGLSVQFTADSLGINADCLIEFERGHAALPPEIISWLCSFYHDPAKFEAKRVADLFEEADEKTQQIMRVILKLPVIKSRLEPSDTNIIQISFNK